MNAEHFDAFDKLFDEIYKGDESAKSIAMQLVKICNIWDDLYDQDKEIDKNDINKAFIASIFEVQNHNLWFSCGLNHHVLNCFLRWRDATNIENDPNSSDDDLMKCYMLRAGFYDIFVIIAYHVHGDDWAREIGPMVRKFYGETPKEYLEEMRNG